MIKKIYLLSLCAIFILPKSKAQTTHIVRPGNYNIPIKEVKFTYNGGTITQTTEASGTIANTSLPINLIHFKIDVNGAPYKTLNFVQTGAIIRSNNFTNNVSGVGVYNQGSTVTANNTSSWEQAMQTSATSANLLNYLYYDGASNVPSGFDFDILWTHGLKAEDYIICGERNGNTCFALTPLDSLGNVITSAYKLQFGNCWGSTLAEYDWNIGYSPTNVTSQPFVFTAISMTQFNTSKTVYGFRIDNTGDADPKFFAMSGNNNFSSNPPNPIISGITGNVYRDNNGLTDNTVNGSGIQSASSNLLYATLDSNGIVKATIQVNADGSYAFLNILSGTYNVRISTVAGTIGASVPQVTLPSPTDNKWEFIGEYSGSGAGNDGNTNGVLNSIVVPANTLKINNNFGIQQIPNSDSYNFTINSPNYNEIKSLTANNNLDSISGYDVEEGRIVSNGNFRITNTSGLNGNVLFYDANNNNTLDLGETLSVNSTISNYNPARLKIKFSGLNTTSLSFMYTLIDQANAIDNTPATYNIGWNTPLPVDLISFDGTPLSNGILLTWATASEINNSHFEVLRSVDAINWTKIGEVTGNGTTQQRIQYQFIDKQPLKVNFYRLRQVDFDGQSELTQIKQVNFDAVVTSILSYPNPTADKVVLNINKINRAEAINIMVSDLTGRTVVQNELIETKNETIAHSVDLSLLQKGMYIIHVVIGEEKHSIKINKI